MLNPLLMITADTSPVHAMPSGLCEDTSGDAAALIARMARGDGPALAEIFGMWAPTLLGISTRMLGDQKEAGKVLRETFVRMWQRAADYDPHQSPPFVWAFAILRELSIKRLRRHPGGKAPHIPPHPGHAEDPRVMVPDDWRRLRSALDSLAPDERACLETAVLLGYARSAKPEPSDTPASAVKACLRRALEKIRNPLSRYEL
jgi:DNA-directed RNA polymerase specialized sigma24 family protein